MIKVGIVGGTGYTGVELLRLLSQHPQVQIQAITSRKEAGMPVADMYPSLRGHVNLAFVTPDDAKLTECDVVFFATPHGVAMAQARELLAAGVKVIGTRTLTRSGHMGGKVVEIVIDESGRINTCEVEENIGERIMIPVQQIVTFGKDVLIVNEAMDPSGRSTLGMRQPAAASYAAPEPSAPPASPAPAPAASDDAAQLFEEKQRRYLLGKRVNRRIAAADGSVIIEQGGEITEEVLQRIREEDKMIELTMNLRL